MLAQQSGSDAANEAADALRIRYGIHASSRTYSHNGVSGMIAFADPECGLVISMIRPCTRVADAVYEDLGLAPTSIRQRSQSCGADNNIMRARKCRDAASAVS